MIVDTQLWAKGIPILGTMLGITSDTKDDVGGSLPGAKEIAWRMTASALKDSVKDMYDGELIIIGDPTVKPYDRVWIEDIIKNIQGQFEVEAVTLSMDAETGFTTSIIPDCISCVDDRYERYNELCFRPIISSIAMTFVPKFLAGRFIFGEHYETFMLNIAKLISKGGGATSIHLANLCRLVDKDPVALSKTILSGTGQLSNVLYSGAGGLDYYRIITESVKKSGARLVGLQGAGSIDDIVEFFAKNGNAIKQADAASLTDLLTAVSKGNKTDISHLNNASASLAAYQARLNQSIASTMTFGDDFYLALENLGTLLEGLDDAEEATLAAAKALKARGAKKIITNSDDLVDLGKALKVAKNMAGSSDELKVVASAVTKIDDLSLILTAIGSIDDVKGLDKAISFIMAATGPIGWLTAFVKFAIEIGISITIGLYATEYIERYLQNLQVLQIYPLTKNGYVMTAGIAGHKGLCVGSPTENTQGAWTTFVTDLFGAKEPNGLIANFVQMFFTSEKAKEIASSYRKNNQLADPVSDSAFDREAMMNRLTSDINKTYAKYSLKNEQFLYKTKRVQKLSSIVDKLKEYTIYDDFNGNKLSTDTCDVLIPLVSDPTLAFFMQQGHLKIFSNLGTEGFISGTFNGEVLTLNYLQEEEQINVPALRAEAVIVFKDICTKFVHVMEYNQNKEDYDEKVKECHLNFTSGTIINDEDSYEGSGLAFRFSILNDDGYADQIMYEINMIYNYDEKNKAIYYQKESVTGEYYVAILPIKQ